MEHKKEALETFRFQGFWRSGWDSNPRALADNLISSQARYDHFDTAPYDKLIQLFEYDT